jgi:hypothetical protein
MVSIILEDYSDNSFVLQGEDTKKYKDKIKELGGKWNSNLKIGPGWIFNIKNKESVKEWLTTLKNVSLKNQNIISKVESNSQVIICQDDNEIEDIVNSFAIYVMDKLEDVDYKKLLYYMYFLEETEEEDDYSAILVSIKKYYFDFVIENNFKYNTYKNIDLNKIVEYTIITILRKLKN